MTDAPNTGSIYVASEQFDALEHAERQHIGLTPEQPAIGLALSGGGLSETVMSRSTFPSGPAPDPENFGIGVPNARELPASSIALETHAERLAAELAGRPGTH